MAATYKSCYNIWACPASLYWRGGDCVGLCERRASQFCRSPELSVKLCTCRFCVGHFITLIMVTWTLIHNVCVEAGEKRVVLVEKRERCGIWDGTSFWLELKPFSGRATAFRTGCRRLAHSLNCSYINTNFREQIHTRQPSEYCVRMKEWCTYSPTRSPM